jgi:Cof subfamily protein (haloacid dehalogenase superfamily)
MELIVFDLDGTLLNEGGVLSTYTAETLEALSARGIAYTVATGRTLHAARHLLEGHGFRLPQVYKNGVMTWNPQTDAYSHQNYLSLHEVQGVLEALLAQSITPFIFTLEPGNHHAIYHPPLQNPIEEKLAADFATRSGVAILPAARIPANAEITNISALGAPASIAPVEALVKASPSLVAYAGEAWEGDNWRWIDVHHSEASKGGAIDVLRQELGLSSVVCFGDSDNDLSMFASADESYAPENAAEHIKKAATAVIGHHDQEGIARFLRERFSL